MHLPSFVVKNLQSTGDQPVTLSIQGQPSGQTLEALIALASVAAAHRAADSDALTGDQPVSLPPSRTHHQT